MGQEELVMCPKSSLRKRTLQSTQFLNRSACPTRRRVLSRRMSEHKVTLTWQRGDKPFEYQKYSRDHIWKFEGGHEMQASAAPAYLGNPKLVDPEEAFVASLSSCHMLTFLAIACKKRFVLDEYTEDRKSTRLNSSHLGN